MMIADPERSRRFDEAVASHVVMWMSRFGAIDQLDPGELGAIVFQLRVTFPLELPPCPRSSNALLDASSRETDCPGDFGGR